MSYQTVAYHYISGNAPDSTKPTTVRHNVLVILHRPWDDHFAVLDWIDIDRKSFVMGGVDDDTLPDAALREITEETWYIDLHYERTLQSEIYAEYYASHKWVNRYSIEHGVVISLQSMTKHDRPLDDQHHRLLRLPRDQVEQFIAQVPGWLTSSLIIWYEYNQQRDILEKYTHRFDVLERSIQFAI